VKKQETEIDESIQGSEVEWDPVKRKITMKAAEVDDYEEEEGFEEEEEVKEEQVWDPIRKKMTVKPS